MPENAKKTKHEQCPRYRPRERRGPRPGTHWCPRRTQQTLAVDVNHGCLARESHEKESQTKTKGTLSDWAKQIEAKLKKQESRHLDKLVDWFKSDPTPNMIDVMGYTLHIIENQVGKVRLKIDPPDFLLAPEVGDIEVLDFHHADEIIEAGRRCVHENEDELLRIFGKR